MSRRYQTILNLFALAAIIFLGVDLFYTTIRAQLRGFDTQKGVMHQLPDVKGNRKAPLDYYRVIINRNIFGLEEEASREIGEEEIEDLKPTSLKLALLGTVVGDQQSAVAVIEEIDKKKQGLYRAGDSVQSAIVRKILRGKIILRVKDRDEILTIEEGAASRAEKEYPKSKPIKKSSTIMVGRSDLEESISNIHQLLSQVRIRPHFRDGKADGLAITNIKPGSIFAKLGLRNGDVVQGINGRDIKSPDDVLEVYNKLKSGSQVALQISRGGRQRIINYKFR
ncbi:MAG: PDZ domain-containing protein [Deltaproteobacteria bacterium]|nr:MAG: PDZ domain-containing protein [Deltaproteobacteria bacterium]